MNKHSDSCIYLPANVDQTKQLGHEFEISGKSTTGYYYNSLGLPISSNFKSPNAAIVPHSVPLIPKHYGAFLPNQLKLAADKVFSSFVEFDWRYKLHALPTHFYGLYYYSFAYAYTRFLMLICIVIIISVDAFVFNFAVGSSILPHLKLYLDITGRPL